MPNATANLTLSYYVEVFVHIWRLNLVQILVDADACPGVIRDILFRASQRLNLPILLVANHVIATPSSALISCYQVPSGFDMADDEIVSRVVAGDLVITADIPLAADVLAKGGHVLTPRGERYTENNIKQRLQMRDFMETMRSSVQQTGGPPPLSLADRKAFADQLDRLLARVLK